MGRSQRANRGPARYNEDRYGQGHYPGTGPAYAGAAHNPAVVPGGAGGYAYDWSNTWPSGTKTPAVIDIGDLEPGGVDGPNPAMNGLTFWLSRSGGQGTLWYYWIDVDSTPGPDTKRLLSDFLADDGINEAYRGEVRDRAMAVGWEE